MTTECGLLICALLLLLGLASVTDLGAAQGGTTALPANASPESYGSGWECDRGFRKAEARCLAVAVPENAHLDFSGHDWVCNEPGIKRGLACTSADRDD